MIENKKYFNVFLSKKYLTFTTFLNNNLRASGREELKKNTMFLFFWLSSLFVIAPMRELYLRVKIVFLSWKAINIGKKKLKGCLIYFYVKKESFD